MLAEHDWYYVMTDDPSNFSRGRESEHKIRNELMKYDLESIVNKLDFIKQQVTQMYQQK